MPHLTIEYSGSLAASRPRDLLLQLNSLLANNGLFAEADIKSRLLRVDDWCVGTAPAGRAFVHARLAMLQGRPLETRRQVAASLLTELRRQWPAPDACEVQWCVEVQEIDSETYVKAGT